MRRHLAYVGVMRNECRAEIVIKRRNGLQLKTIHEQPQRHVLRLHVHG